MYPLLGLLWAFWLYDAYEVKVYLSDEAYDTVGRCWPRKYGSGGGLVNPSDSSDSEERSGIREGRVGIMLVVEVEEETEKPDDEEEVSYSARG